MSEWKISPAGVEGVLNTMADHHETLSKLVTEDLVNGILEDVTVASPFADSVRGAVEALLADQQQGFTSMCSRVAAGICGVGEATLAYNRGQLDMAGQFQAAIAQGSTGDFSFFDEHGQMGR